MLEQTHQLLAHADIPFVVGRIHLAVSCINFVVVGRIHLAVNRINFSVNKIPLVVSRIDGQIQI